ncbi:MAG: SCO family protein [Deltaproteobacteria bacterium]
MSRLYSKNTLIAFVVSLVALISGPATPLWASDPVATANAAIGKKIPGYTLIDQDNNALPLKGLMGRPLVISYIYTSCPHVCSNITGRLKQAFAIAKMKSGGDFTALSIGFDPDHDTPSVLKSFGARFTDDFTKWRFATAGAKTIQALTKELGFYYERLPDGGFDHMNLTTVVGRDGTILKQVYGMNFNQEELVNAVVLASGSGVASAFLNPSGIIDKVILFCYRYDEVSGIYRLNFGAIAALALGSALQGATLVWIVYKLFRRGSPKLLD